MVKRIAFFHDSFPDGGAERVTLDIAQYLAGHGYEVVLMARLYHEGKMPPGAAQSLRIVTMPEGWNRDTHEGADVLVRQIRELGIGILVVPVLNLKTLGYIRERAPQCRLVFAHHGMPFWEAADAEQRKRRQASGNLFRGLKWALYYYPKFRILKSYLKRNVATYRRTYDNVDAYTVLCEGYKRTLVGTLGLDPLHNRITVIPNAEKPVAAPRMDKKKQVMFMGRFTYPDKRVDRLLNIWGMVCEQAPEWELVLVGDGPERESLERQAARMRLPRVRFEGYSTDPQRYYRDAAVLCLTSNYEGWPLSLTEAQANGVVPVAFGCTDGVREILSPSGENGLIIPPFDMKAYAGQLLALMRDDEQRRRMSRNVVEKAREYAPDAVGAKWLALFESFDA